jgi:hypothetical protein
LKSKAGSREYREGLAVPKGGQKRTEEAAPPPPLSREVMSKLNQTVVHINRIYRQLGAIQETIEGGDSDILIFKKP